VCVLVDAMGLERVLADMAIKWKRMWQLKLALIYLLFYSFYFLIIIFL
jgi:hypothetical protein